VIGGRSLKDGVVGLQLVAPFEKDEAIEHFVKSEDLKALVQDVAVGLVFHLLVSHLSRPLRIRRQQTQQYQKKMRPVDHTTDPCLVMALFLSQIQLKDNSTQLKRLDEVVRNQLKENCPGHAKLFEGTTNPQYNYGYTSYRNGVEFHGVKWYVMTDP
jgi:hypothetical protein